MPCNHHVAKIVVNKCHVAKAMPNQPKRGVRDFFKRQYFASVFFFLKNYKYQNQNWLYLQGRISYLSL